jgi:hypothetical protein
MLRQEIPDLTPHQERILDCIRETITAFGEAPTVRETAGTSACAASAASTTSSAKIEQKGAIVIERDRNRGIRLA